MEDRDSCRKERMQIVGVRAVTNGFRIHLQINKSLIFRFLSPPAQWRWSNPY